MLQINKILFPTDYSSCAERAFTHAAFLAGWHEAELHVLNVVEPSQESTEDLPNGLHLSEEEIADQLRLALDERREVPKQEHAKSEREENLRIVQAQVDGVVASEGILSYAREKDMDLVVMGTHGRRGARRLLMGSVAEEVVRQASCPVMTVCTGEEDRSHRTFERILVPIDFSEYSPLAIGYAVELAQTYGARLDLLHVVDEVTFTGIYGLESVAVSFQDVVQRAEEALAKMVREEIGFEHVLAKVRAGHPPTDIVETAREQEADLIVIPTHGRTGFRHFLMGSVAEKVVRRAPCPVFTVKSFGRSLLPASGEGDSAAATRTSGEESNPS